MEHNPKVIVCVDASGNFDAFTWVVADLEKIHGQLTFRTEEPRNET